LRARRRKIGPEALLQRHRRPERNAMVLEIAQIDVKPGMESEFEAGANKAVPLFQRAKGCKGMELQRSVEHPNRYRLFVKWETLENHTVDFRGSADFQEWRKLVAHCFEQAPQVEHTRQVVHGH
jgi:heme-degrading monooxygenase HmoA